MKSTVWNLQNKAGRRFRHGHPWVFANELSQSPKGLTPGAPVELRDERGLLLAKGYGNPNSLICFRTLERGGSAMDPWDAQYLGERVVRASHWRTQIGLQDFSHRLVFGEADDLPGLVIDRFVDQTHSEQVLVVQVLTAGMEFLLPDLGHWVKGWVQEATKMRPEATTLIVRRDVGARKLEGLPIEEPKVVSFGKGQHSLKNFPAWIRSGLGEGGLEFTLDLVGGQKTGFFFDQAGNIEQLVRQLTVSSPTVLDLFCYVGQWGAQVAATAKKHGGSALVHLVDGSQAALALAKQNVETQGGRAEIYERDILEGLPGIPDADVVICDPPAFIKSKKDHGPGLRGYLKANAIALNKVKPGGWFVSCSCSHHLSDSDFTDILRQAEERSGRRVNWTGRGIQAPDHPVRMGFPEGQYLKAWFGRVLK